MYTFWTRTDGLTVMFPKVQNFPQYFTQQLSPYLRDSWVTEKHPWPLPTLRMEAAVPPKALCSPTGLHGVTTHKKFDLATHQCVKKFSNWHDLREGSAVFWHVTPYTFTGADVSRGNNESVFRELKYAARRKGADTLRSRREFLFYRFE